MWRRRPGLGGRGRTTGAYDDSASGTSRYRPYERVWQNANLQTWIIHTYSYGVCELVRRDNRIIVTSVCIVQKQTDGSGDELNTYILKEERKKKKSSDRVNIHCRNEYHQPTSVWTYTNHGCSIILLAPFFFFLFPSTFAISKNKNLV